MNNTLFVKTVDKVNSVTCSNKNAPTQHLGLTQCTCNSAAAQLLHTKIAA